MSVRELLEQEINTLEQNDLVLIYSFIQTIKRKNRRISPVAPKFKNYILIREILSKCRGSLSEDVIAGREDRI